MIAAILWTIAYFWDRLLGDPRWLPHPVIGIGRCISSMERLLRRWFTQDKLKAAGFLLPIVIVGGAFGATWLLLWALALVHPWLSYGVEAILIATTIAVKGLQDAGMKVYNKLAAGDMDGARFETSMIVGRDTDTLDEPELVRATVETVAENIVDAVISPLFYALLGGAPLAMAYRAVNTLDSMVGYKNEKYEKLGYASAKLDDLANWIPARMTAGLVALSAWLFRAGDAKRALKTVLSDAVKHPSPNSGWPEASVAGALHIRLGGFNVYKGVRSFREYMGEPLEVLAAKHIPATCRLLRGTSILFAALGLAALWLRGGWLL